MTNSMASHRGSRNDMVSRASHLGAGGSMSPEKLDRILSGPFLRESKKSIKKEAMSRTMQFSSSLREAINVPFANS